MLQQHLVIATYSHTHTLKANTQDTHTHTFIIHHTDAQSDLRGFGGFSGSLRLPKESLSTSWFQLFSFTPTIPYLKNPFLHFCQSTLALTLHNTPSHAHSTATQPSHAHSTSPFTIPLHLEHIFNQSQHKVLRRKSKCQPISIANYISVIMTPH